MLPPADAPPHRDGRRPWCSLVIAVLALGAPWFAVGSTPTTPPCSIASRPPSAAHLMGTDELGRDMYSRIVHGARYSLAIAALTALGSVLARHRCSAWWPASSAASMRR